MTIRPAAVADVRAVAELERDLFGVDAWSEAAVHEELTGPRRHALVAAEGGEVCGYVVTLRSDDVLDLQRIAVAVAHQRSGVARALLAGARSAGRAAGATRMLLEVSDRNQEALSFYAAEGFTQIDRRLRYYKDGSDAVVMRAPLGAAGCGGSGA